MSQFMPDQTAERPPSTPPKGPEEYLSPDERKFIQRYLSFPEDIPPKFKSWLIDFIAVNIPQIPISQIVGIKQSLFKLLDSAEITSSVTVTTTSESSPTIIISGAAKVFDGKPLLVFVNFPSITLGGTLNFFLSLWEDGVDRGRIGLVAGSSGGSLTVIHRYTPAPGTHTFSIRGWVTVASATVDVGAGGVGIRRPGQLTIFSMPESAQ